MNSILRFSRKYSAGPPVSIYQNLYASKPAVRNRPKTENFKPYESLGNVKQPIWREPHPTEKSLGPIEDDRPKEGTYKNPEYYSYHNYSFHNLAMAMQCLYQPQPSALEEQDLVEQTTKSCYVVETKPWNDESLKKNPPPSCGGDDCTKDSKEGKDDPNCKQETNCEDPKVEEPPKCDGIKTETKK